MKTYRVHYRNNNTNTNEFVDTMLSSDLPKHYAEDEIKWFNNVSLLRIEEI